MSRIALRNLVVRQLYGRDFDSVAIAGLDDGLTVVYGPNGSGKTTLAQASSLLFNAHKKNVKRSDRIRAEIVLNGDLKKVELDGPQDDPSWPQSPRVGLYRLNITDIITGPAEEDTARIRDALAGGINLTKLEPPGAGRPPRDPLIRSAKKLQDARVQAEELQRSEAQLQQQRDKLAEATTAQSDLGVVDAWLEAAQIESEAVRLSNEIAVLDQQHPGIEHQDQKAADDAETQLLDLQTARSEALDKRQAIRECSRKRARRVLQDADREMLKRLKDEAKQLDGQIDSARQRCRECEAAVADAKRQLQRVRPDQRRAADKLDTAILESHVKKLNDAYQLLTAAEVELARATQTLGDTAHDFQLVGGNPQQHPATTCPAHQVQALVDLDAAISECRSVLDDVQQRIAAAEQEVQHRLAAFKRLTVPPRQVLDELLREPSIAHLQDQLRDCLVKQQAYTGAADALSSPGQEAGGDLAVQQALQALRDWLRAIPDQRGREVPAVLIIACFAVAAISLLLGFFAPAVIAGVVVATALTGIGVTLLVLRRRPAVEDRRRSAESRVPQKWLPADWSIDSVAARYADAATVKAEGAAIVHVMRDLRLAAQQLEVAQTQEQLSQKIRALAPYVQMQNTNGYVLSYLVPRLSELQSAQSSLDELKRLQPQHAQKLEQLQTQRTTLLAQLGCGGQTGAAAKEWAAKLDALLRAENQQRDRQRGKDTTQAERDRSMHQFHDFLQQHDWPTEGEPRVLADQLKEWFEVSARLEQAESDKRRAGARLQELCARRHEVDGEIAALFGNYSYSTNAAAVDAIVAFESWFERCGQWVQSVRRANQLRRNLRARLDDAGAPEAQRTLRHRVTILRQRENSARQRRDLTRERDEQRVAVRAMRERYESQRVFLRRGLPQDPDQQQLMTKRDDLRLLADQRDQLNQQISATEALINQRGQQRIVADAEHERAQAIEQVQDWLDSRSDELAMQTVLDRIRDLFRGEEQPKRIATANSWLQRLTGGRYGDIESVNDEIRVTDGVDESRRKTIRELSTGAQVHLALAVRLAVIESSEKQDRFPLFLDELMATSDAAASLAVAEAVKQISADRQVVVFTNQADDIAILRQVLGGDLPVKSLAAAAPLAYAPPTSPPDAPAPLAHGNSMPIASPIPHWPPAHLAAILPELNQSAGSIREAIEQMQDGRGASLEAKLDALEAIRREVAKSHRRVQWTDIEEQGWTQGRLRDRIQSAWEQSKGQPRQFLKTLGEVERIRQDRIDACEQWLNDNGYLTQPPTLEGLAQIAVATLPADYPDKVLIAQALALAFALYM